MTVDYAVVGGGVAGSTCALILARAGLRVALVEQQPRLAPIVRGFRRGGVLFDTGFHYTGGLEPGGILRRFFRHLGIDDSLRPRSYSLEAFDVVRYCADGGDFAFPGGGGRVRKALKEAFPDEVRGIDGYLDAMAEAAGRFPYLNLEAPLDKGLVWERTGGDSLAEVFDRLGLSGPLRSVLAVHCVLHGATPAEVAFAQHASVVWPYYCGPAGLEGGGEALVRALERELVVAGVDVRLGSAADSLELDGGGAVRGLRLADGTSIPCGGCVAACHPHEVLRWLPAGVLRPAYRKRLARLEESASAWMAFGRCARAPELLADSNMLLLPSPAWQGELAVEEPGEGLVYLARAAAGDGFVALMPARALGAGGGEATAAERAWWARRLGEVLAQHCPELGEFEFLATATARTLHRYGAVPYGSLYGPKHRVGQLNPGAETRLPGLYLSGQATAAPGVLGAMVSAFISCGAILGHERLRGELRECH